MSKLCVNFVFSHAVSRDWRIITAAEAPAARCVQALRLTKGAAKKLQQKISMKELAEKVSLLTT